MVLTRANLDKPWIHFEAGALISKLERKVSPLLVQISETDLKPPLSLLNATFFDKEDVRRLAININDELGEKRVPADTLNKVFEKFWPDLSSAIEAHIAKDRSDTSSRPNSPKRDQAEILEELVTIVRDLQRRPQAAGLSPSLTTVSRHLLSAFSQISGGVTDDIDRDGSLEILGRICDEYLKIVQRVQVEERPVFLEQLERVRRNVLNAKDGIPF